MVKHAVKKMKVVTGDSDKLFGPDAGMFAYNGSELASWKQGMQVEQNHC